MSHYYYIKTRLNIEFESFLWYNYICIIIVIKKKILFLKKNYKKKKIECYFSQFEY